MLSKPQRVRQVYEELRRVFGKSLSAGDLLRHASSIVELFERENDVPSEFLKPVESRSIDPSLDVAFSDGGWKLLSRESRWLQNLSDDEPFIPSARRRKRYPEMERSLYPWISGRIPEGWIIKDEE